MNITETINVDRVEADLAAAVDVPTITGAQSQGDLIVLPWPADVAAVRRTTELGLCKPVPQAGVVVLAGNGGHEHKLAHDPAGGVAWYAYPIGGQTLGVLAVEDGAVGVLGHMEHGDTHIGPGVYVIRRQREQADQIRLVQD